MCLVEKVLHEDHPVDSHRFRGVVLWFGIRGNALDHLVDLLKHLLILVGQIRAVFVGNVTDRITDLPERLESLKKREFDPIEDGVTSNTSSNCTPQEIKCED